MPVPPSMAPSIEIPLAVGLECPAQPWVLHLGRGTFQPRFPLKEPRGCTGTEEPCPWLGTGISTDEQGLPGEAKHLLCQELLSKSLILQAGIALSGDSSHLPGEEPNEACQEFIQRNNLTAR